MTNSKKENQPTLFEPQPFDATRISLYALGEFQARGKKLAGRELALDRLRGAFRRTAEKFQTDELNDETIAETLQNLGAKVIRKQIFVAKHPFRITVETELADRAKNFFEGISKDE